VKRVAVSIGPEYGTVGSDHIKDAAKEAVQGLGYDLLVVCGFTFDPGVSEESKRYGKLQVLITRMNTDLLLGDQLLKKTGAGNLFMVFGEPDVEIKQDKGKVTAILASQSGGHCSNRRTYSISKPSSSSTCEPHAAKPNDRAMSVEARLSGEIESKKQRWPWSEYAQCIRASTASVAYPWRLNGAWIYCYRAVNTTTLNGRAEKSASASVAGDTPPAVAISYGLKAMVIRVASRREDPPQAIARWQAKSAVVWIVDDAPARSAFPPTD
jgi:hypothetical protein